MSDVSYALLEKRSSSSIQTDPAPKPSTKWSDCAASLCQWITKGAQVQVKDEGSEIPECGGQAEHVVGLLSGWAFTYRTFEDGRRQILDIHLPGSLIGLGLVPNAASAFGCETLTQSTYCVVKRKALIARAALDASVAVQLFAEMLRQQGLLRARLADLSRRCAHDRIANFLFELWCRVGPARSAERAAGFSIPLTQSQIADALGLTSIHVSRILKDFKQKRVIEYSGRNLVLCDPAGLRRMSSLDHEYVDWLHASRVDLMRPFPVVQQ